MPRKAQQQDKEKESPKAHHETCGEVGDTGDHGEIGSNAADSDHASRTSEEAKKDE
jgi:hypothetical protein